MLSDTPSGDEGVQYTIGRYLESGMHCSYWRRTDGGRVLYWNSQHELFYSLDIDNCHVTFMSTPDINRYPLSDDDGVILCGYEPLALEGSKKKTGGDTSSN